MSRRIVYDSDYTAERLTPADCAIFISASGTNAVTLRVARTAKQRGAYIASITLDSENPLRELSNLQLLFFSGESGLDNRFAPDLTGLMLIVRKIAETYWQSCQELV